MLACPGKASSGPNRLIHASTGPGLTYSVLFRLRAELPAHCRVSYPSLSLPVRSPRPSGRASSGLLWSGLRGPERDLSNALGPLGQGSLRSGCASPGQPQPTPSEMSTTPKNGWRDTLPYFSLPCLPCLCTVGRVPTCQTGQTFLFPSEWFPRPSIYSPSHT